MTFRDDQGIRRFFRLRDYARRADIDTLKAMQGDYARRADIDTLKAMQKKLSDKKTEEAIFIEDLKREINRKLDKQRKG